MKDKILAALKTKYSNLGFSEKAFGGVAEFLATTITEEDKIETGITWVENLLKAFQSDADKLRTENANLKKQLEKKADPPKPDPKPEQKTDTEVPEWAKALVDANKSLREELDQFKAGKTAEDRKSILEKELGTSKLKDSVLKAYSRMAFKDDEDFNAYLEEIKESVKAEVKTETEEGFSAFPKPTSGSGGGGREASKEEVQQILNHLF